MHANFRNVASCRCTRWCRYVCKRSFAANDPPLFPLLKRTSLAKRKLPSTRAGGSACPVLHSSGNISQNKKCNYPFEGPGAWQTRLRAGLQQVYPATSPQGSNITVYLTKELRGAGTLQAPGSLAGHLPFDSHCTLPATCYLQAAGRHTSSICRCVPAAWPLGALLMAPCPRRSSTGKIFSRKSETGRCLLITCWRLQVPH